jgi:hypothetical protein
VERATPKSSAISVVVWGAGLVQCDQVSLLGLRQLGLLAPEPALGLGDGHALAGAHSDQVGFELCNRAEDVEQQPTDRVGRVVDAAAEVQGHALARQLIGDVARVGQ